jgi:TolB protein
LTKIFVLAADGSGLRAVPGTEGGVAPVFAPDGRTLAFTKERKEWRQNHNGGETQIYESDSAWLVDIGVGQPHQLTPWRNRLMNVPSSFSPDGTTLALSRRFGDRDSEAIAMRLDGSGSITLAHNGLEPTYSPDGSEIALLRGHEHTFKHRGGVTVATLTDLFVMRSDGAGMRRLTDTPDAAELAPSWDPSARRLAYTRFGSFASEAGLLGFGDAIMEVNADGTCPTEVISQPQAAFYGASWQPGPGRGAGPISC